ncbi:hypothetical protein BDN70DRAFT_615170 [Pholiota conissans]|uniref:Uncharacterized protein n=1 Tax=Pholiota conissans TaxID=109636 RepID=A0A9P5YKZ6_9AGAR|nr:hypothetical protein BDN70DRAFT_615170 [Pholiota conissans]
MEGHRKQGENREWETHHFLQRAPDISATSLLHSRRYRQLPSVNVSATSMHTLSSLHATRMSARPVSVASGTTSVLDTNDTTCDDNIRRQHSFSYALSKIPSRWTKSGTFGTAFCRGDVRFGVVLYSQLIKATAAPFLLDVIRNIVALTSRLPKTVGIVYKTTRMFCRARKLFSSIKSQAERVYLQVKARSRQYCEPWMREQYKAGKCINHLTQGINISIIYLLKLPHYVHWHRCLPYLSLFSFFSIYMLYKLNRTLTPTGTGIVRV